MIWNEDFDPKIRTFWDFGGGGKEKKWSCVVACWVLNENSTQRDLSHVKAISSFHLGMSETVWVKSIIQF